MKWNIFFGLKYCFCPYNFYEVYFVYLFVCLQTIKNVILSMILSTPINFFPFMSNGVFNGMLRCMDYHIKQNKNKNTHKVGHMTRNYWSHALWERNQIDKKKKTPIAS